MGTEGMKASLVSREVIADSIETVCFGESMDGLVAVAACDKNMPGSLMAMARLNIPSVFVYGGAILPGNYLGKDINIQDMFEAVGSHSKGNLTLDELFAMERIACPGEGACAGMFTANTMSSAIEALGMSIPGAASVPAIDPKSEGIAHQAAAAVQGMLERGIMPRDIMTKEAFENAIMVVLAMGGSTNAVLHLLAIAHEANVDLKIDDFDRLSRVTPYLTDLRPAGRYVMSDLDKVGGVPVVMRELLNAGLLHPQRHDGHRQGLLQRTLTDLDIPAADGDVGPPHHSPALAHRGVGHPARKPLARGVRDEGVRHQAPATPRPGSRVRRRTRHLRGSDPRRDQSR